MPTCKRAQGSSPLTKSHGPRRRLAAERGRGAWGALQAACLFDRHTGIG